VKAWVFDTAELDEGSEDRACIRTFKGHSKGVYPLIFIPSEDSGFSTDGLAINPGDLLISGSADHTARSWSFDTGGCLKVIFFIYIFINFSLILLHFFFHVGRSETCY
jgi:WD40 repeat protein